jgi:NADPH:quinone reductase-like Zn-dependent oxidoreductase
MKAMVVESKGAPFVERDVPTPTPKSDEALIKLRASSLNRRDYYIQHGLYPRTVFPVIPGADGAGVVVQVGDAVSPALLNTEVIINPALNWGTNPKVQQREFRLLGFPDNGTFAEYVVVPARLVHPKPRHLSLQESAALPVASVTAYRALFTRGNIQPDETLLITGIGGGVALAALQFAHAIGARVYVTSGSDEKIQRAVALGAAGGVNYKSERWAEDVLRLAGGFHVIVDGTAGPLFSKLLEIATPGGRIVSYGSVLGKIQDAEPGRIFWKQLSILGSTMGTEEEFAAMLRFVEQHAITPILDNVYSLRDIGAAMLRMENSHQFGKIILRHDSSDA